MRTFIKSTLYLLLLLPMSFFAQNTVSGTVTESATSLPVPGANVIVKGTTNGTTTDFDGNYTIENVSAGDVLVYSFWVSLPRRCLTKDSRPLIFC